MNFFFINAVAGIIPIMNRIIFKNLLQNFKCTTFDIMKIGMLHT